MANAIVGQMLSDGVVKGGSSLKLRYGDANTRFTTDLDTAYRQEIDNFISTLEGRLRDGWSDFSGRIIKRSQARPEGVPIEYVSNLSM